MAERKLNGLSEPPAVRCFVGALVAAPSARRLRAAFLHHYPALAEPGTPGPAGARVVPLANFHVTIRFLGQVPAAELPGLAALVAGLGATAVAADVVGFTGLPRPGRAHAAVAELAPHPALADWKHRLEQSVGAEERPYRPHVTLARFRRIGHVAAIPLAPAVAIALQAPRLFRSDPVRGGVRYSPVSVEPPA